MPLSASFPALRPMEMLDVWVWKFLVMAARYCSTGWTSRRQWWKYRTSGRRWWQFGVRRAWYGSTEVNGVHSERLRPVCFLLSHITLGLQASRVPILYTTTSQFPVIIKTITLSKTGDVHVMEKAGQPFLNRGPGDAILEVYVITTRTLRPMMTYLFIVADVGRVCWCRLHRHLLQEWALPHPTPRDRRIGMIVVLPADPAVLNHPEYQGKCYATRAKDITVRIAQRLHFPVLDQLSYPVLSVFSRRRREVHRHPPRISE